MPDPIDTDKGFVYTGMAVYQGLGVHPETVGEIVMQTMYRMPRNEDGSEFANDEIAELPEEMRRPVLLEEIAQRDAQIVLEAFGNGDKTVDLSDYDVDPVAELLLLSAIPDPDREQLAAEIERKQC